MHELTVSFRQRLAQTDPKVWGTSPWAIRTRREIATVAPCTTSVLIVGPTGTGKELIARCIHAQSARRQRPFIPVDCASISGPLCASQLFGHIQGAFTGADYESMGCFRAADGGTIFLDEIGELDPHLQAMLLRTVQERIVTPVGSQREIPVDVRIIAATNRDLDQEVGIDHFRLDLLYRLRVVSIETVPLRDRPEDIPLLADHFLARLASENGIPVKQLAASSLKALCGHDWPGNVRELQNVLERAAVFSNHEEIGPGALQFFSALDDPTPDQQSPETPSSGDLRIDAAHPDLGAWPTLSQIEANHIASTLELVGFNQSAAARLLDINRQLLARKIKKHGLQGHVTN